MVSYLKDFYRILRNNIWHLALILESSFQSIISPQAYNLCMFHEEERREERK